MKKIAICLFILNSLFSLDSFAQKKKKQRDATDDCLAIIGFFYNQNQIRNINAYLYEGPNIIDSTKVNSMKDFGFILKKNKEYSLKIVAKGYYPRLISFDTRLPDDVSIVPVFVFEFDIILIPEIKGVDDYFTDFPIALVEFEPKTQKFNYNKKYTAKIQKELDKVKDQFKVRKSR